MDSRKLKLDSFSKLMLVNFPDSIDLGLESTDSDIEAIIYYINEPEDVARFVKLCNSTPLPKENRTIMVYQKGRKDGVNRDTIFLPFKEGTYPNFKLKAPMLCSLSKELSACVMARTEG